MQKQEVILVAAPNCAGENFIKELKQQGIAFAALTNNKNDSGRLRKLGTSSIITVKSGEYDTWLIPESPIGSVYLFENSFNLCCRYIQMCRSWTSKPIYVITHSFNPRLVYKRLGANYVIYTHSDDVSFLLKSGGNRDE
ncbi:hypothetical protein [Paenibacillus albiflavus]|uniref:hypothetical protein n=1 Tax=Paenibacillus albiflavus TaxID=2545760 RepID=UPI001A9E8537|nr:hypothetical protein [Paenibacillus albiflavus]